MTKEIRYTAVVRNVREVTLRGAADLPYWQERLRTDGLEVVERDGRAEILIIAARMRFKGVRFTEVSFSVLVRAPEERAQPGAFLVQAFQSSHVFAFCERVLFSTPYLHGDCDVSLSPASMRIARGGEELFRAEMGAVASDPARSGTDGWKGAVFLPAQGRRRGPGRFFFASIAGATRFHPFTQGKDAVTVRPAGGGDIFEALRDSRFAGVEWEIREDATHSRSKTCKRSAVPRAR